MFMAAFPEHAGTLGFELSQLYVVCVLLNSCNNSQIGYDPSDKHAGHPAHVDDCAVTLNLCLQAPKRGGELKFENTKRIQQKTGQCIIHPGDQKHMAYAVQEGRRYNLIMWFNKKSEFTRLCELPKELQMEFVSHLKGKSKRGSSNMLVKELLELSRCNKFFNAACNLDSVWANLYQKDLANPPAKTVPKKSQIDPREKQTRMPKDEQPRMRLKNIKFGELPKGPEWKVKYAKAYHEKLLPPPQPLRKRLKRKKPAKRV